MKLHEEIYEIFRPLISSSHPQNAIDVLKKLVETWPNFAIAHNDLGVLYYDTGDKEKALMHYQKATRFQPSNITFQKNLADFYYVEQGRVEEALQLYVKILEIDPEDVETLLVTGHICVALNQFDDAKVFYNRVLEIEPWKTEIQENLKKLEKAQQVEINPKPAEKMYLDIQNTMDNAQPKKTIQRLEKLIQSWPDFAIAHNDLGVLYYNSGEKEKALTHYQEAVRLHPEKITFQKNLADFYYVEQKRTKEALQLYVKIMESNPEDVETLLATAHICEALNQNDDAKVFYNRVVEIEPWNPVAREHLKALETSKNEA